MPDPSRLTRAVPQLIWSCLTNLWEAISLLRRSGSKSWSMFYDQASITLSIAACINIGVMMSTYNHDPSAIHNDDTDHLFNDLVTVIVFIILHL